MANGSSQQYATRKKLTATGPILDARCAAAAIDAPLVVGSGAAALVAARGDGEAMELLPSAANAMLLPKALRSLAVTPAYARPPDAQPRAAA